MSKQDHILRIFPQNELNYDSLVQLLDNYIDETFIHLNALLLANSTNDKEGIFTHCHSIRGSSLTYGATKIAEAACLLEDNLDKPHNITSLINQLETAILELNIFKE